MKSIENILDQLKAGEFEFIRHAFRRTIERNVSDSEIIQAADNARIIEEYPQDKYAPSCLILGFTNAGRPIRIQVSFVASDLVKIITLYQPNESEWIDYSQRR